MRRARGNHLRISNLSTTWICELCLIRRLERRADIVTATSSPTFGVKPRAREHLRRAGQEASQKGIGRESFSSPRDTLNIIQKGG